MILFSLWLARSVVRPVRRVARASAALGAGDLTTRVAEDETDELGVLARSFNSMADSLVAGLEAQEESRLELERQNAELRRLDELKDDFVAVVSHELRTPLTSICGYLELVLEGEGGELTDDQRDLLGVVERNAERLLLIVNDLLLIAQAEAGRLAVERAEVDLAELVHQAAETAAPRAADGRVTLEVHVPGPVSLAGDAVRLGQLLDNLISNALKFTPAGGRVSVSAEEDGLHARLEVRDTGVGISLDEQQRLFSRFFRTAHAMRESIPGTGLGLAISQAIAEAHDGVIEVESELGAGTTFRVLMPLARAGTPAASGVVEVAR